jgi:hypothetical protein
MSAAQMKDALKSMQNMAKAAANKFAAMNATQQLAAMNDAIKNIDTSKGDAKAVFGDTKPPTVGSVAVGKDGGETKMGLTFEAGTTKEKRSDITLYMLYTLLFGSSGTPEWKYWKLTMKVTEKAAAARRLEGRELADKYDMAINYKTDSELEEAASSALATLASSAPKFAATAAVLALAIAV